MKMEIKNNTTHILGPHDAKPQKKQQRHSIFSFDKNFTFLKTISKII